MNHTETINWKKFKETLLKHPTFYLQFKYAENRLVDAAYHITEIKQASITSVDCGGKMNNWTEVIVQLWVPHGRQQKRPMKVAKALSIISIVEKMMPLDSYAIVKIEFGNAEFDTRQMFPIELFADSDSLTINLMPDTVQCKAINRGGTCRTDNKGEECCTTAVAEKPKSTLINLAVAAGTCSTPGGGCC